MAVDRDLLTRQIQRADVDLSERVKALDANGVDAKNRKLDPHWRRLNARCRQLKRRLRAAQSIVDRDQEVAARKEAAATAE